MPRCIAILGPTCSWKTEVGLLLAEAVGGEIISCDSMQVYRGLDVGTAKPAADVRARVPHHLVDVLELQTPYSAGVFAAQAEQILVKLNDRGCPGVLVGGTGLYAKAFVYGLTERPTDWRIAREVWTQYETPGGPELLRAELAAVDPANTALSDPNPRRLMRAVALLRITGTAPGAQTHGNPVKTPRPGFAQWVILPSMPVLRQRIAARTQAMLANGWIDETRALVDAGLLQAPTARQALGYREIAAFLAMPRNQRDAKTLETSICQKTVAYARRQRTWFRHQHPGCRTIEVADANTTSRSLADMILKQLRDMRGPDPSTGARGQQ